ncbi:hypothetical protein AKJ16_DCAP25999, partial [Drosera capensis]
CENKVSNYLSTLLEFWNNEKLHRPSIVGTLIMRWCGCGNRDLSQTERLKYEVDRLIDVGSKSWNKVIVEASSPASIATDILSIPIGLSERDDWWA